MDYENKLCWYTFSPEPRKNVLEKGAILYVLIKTNEIFLDAFL